MASLGSEGYLNILGDYRQKNRRSSNYTEHEVRYQEVLVDGALISIIPRAGRADFR
jgi:hypothetical protein